MMMGAVTAPHSLYCRLFALQGPLADGGYQDTPHFRLGAF